MKKLFLSLIAAVISLTAQAQLREDAFTICTNDGDKQGLLFGDVEKITFSNLDDEGVPHSGVYYQELHYADTILRTPISEIDSVSFAKPRVQYQPDVVLGHETGLFNDIYSCRETENGHTLYFYKSDLRDYMVPKVGQMITYLGTDGYILNRLGGAFAGRVKSITLDEYERYVIETERPDRMRDIFKEFVGVGVITNDTPGVRDALRKAGALPKNTDMSTDMHRINISGEGSHRLDFDLPLGYSWSKEDDKEEGSNVTSTNSFSVKGGVRGSLGIRVSFELTDLKEYLSVITTNEYTPYFNLEVATETTWEKKKEPVETPILHVPIPSAPMFSLTVGIGSFFRVSGKVALSLDKTFPTTMTRSFNCYHNGEYSTGKRNVSDPKGEGVDNDGDLSLSVNMEGSIMGGACVGIYVGTERFFKTTVGILAEANIGPKLWGTIGGDFSYTAPEGDSKGRPDITAYNFLKNCSLNVSWCSVELAVSYYQEVLGNKKKITFANTSFDLNTTSISAIPSFEAPEWNLPPKDSIPDWSTVWHQNTHPIITMESPEGNSLIPINPGYALYDEDDNFITSMYEDGISDEYPGGRQYWMGTQNDSIWKNLQWNESIDGIQWEPNKDYRLYPAFMIDGQEYRAEPCRTVRFDGKVNTGGYEFDITEKPSGLKVVRALVHCYADEVVRMSPNVTVGVLISTDSQQLRMGKGDFWDSDAYYANEPPYDSDYYTYVGNPIDGLETGTKYYYCACAKAGDRFAILGDINSFTTPKFTYQ